MMNASKANEQSVIELLATWGATADPGVADLFHVLDERCGRDDSSLVQTLLERSAALLEPELKRELEELQAAVASGQAQDASFASRMERAVGRAGAAVDSDVTSRRAELTRQLVPWAPVLGREQLDDILNTIARSETGGTVPDRLDALDHLQRARELLDGSRKRVEDEIRHAAESVAASEVRGLAARAIEANDATALIEVRRRLSTLGKQKDREEQSNAVQAAAKELSERCRQLESAIGSAGSLSEASRSVLATALDAARQAHADGQSGRRAEDLSVWIGTLQSMIESLADGAAATSRVDLMRTLLVTLEDHERRAGATGGAEAEAGARRAAELRAALEKHGDSGGPEFMAVVQQSMEFLRASGARAASEADGKLQESASALADVLGRYGAVLPTGDVVEARRLLDKAMGVATSRDADRMSPLAAEIAKRIERLKKLAQRAERAHRSRADAAKDRLNTAIDRLLEVAEGTAARRLEALREEVEGADARSYPEMERRLAGQASEVEGAVRLHACQILQRGEKRAGSESGDKQLEQRVDALREALEGDDLGHTVRASEELVGAVGSGSSRSGPILQLALVALVLVVPLAGFFGWQWATNRSLSYQVSLAEGVELTGEVQVTLIHDGEVFERRSYDGRAVSFSLPNGRYEVYVNDRFTGRVIRVPEDSSPVDGIPLPAVAAGD